jgi:hypothetical protein
MAYRSRAGPVRRRPAFHTARSVRFKSTPVTGTARRVPAASSAATARELRTARGMATGRLFLPMTAATRT